MIEFNQTTQLILADVDETIADVYTDATPAMIHELSRILASGRTIALITGAGLGSVKERITDLLDPSLRYRVIIAHCSGAEIVGFDKAGKLLSPFYSVYTSKMTSEQQMTWRSIVSDVIAQYQLKTVAPQRVDSFYSQHGRDPLTVMLADRGPQITLEVVNGYQLTQAQYSTLKHLFPNLSLHNSHYDLREALLATFYLRFTEAHLPVTPLLAGMFALDLVLEGVSKTKALEHLLTNSQLLEMYGLPTDISNKPSLLEIWGDKFAVNGGSDRKMCLAVAPETRAIDFRTEDPASLGKEYNIQLWDGTKHLHEGLLEYLQSSTIS